MVSILPWRRSYIKMMYWCHLLLAHTPSVVSLYPCVIVQEWCVLFGFYSSNTTRWKSKLVSATLLTSLNVLAIILDPSSDPRSTLQNYCTCNMSYRALITLERRCSNRGSIQWKGERRNTMWMQEGAFQVIDWGMEQMHTWVNGKVMGRRRWKKCRKDVSDDWEWLN